MKTAKLFLGIGLTKEETAICLTEGSGEGAGYTIRYLRHFGASDDWLKDRIADVLEMTQKQPVQVYCDEGYAKHVKWLCKEYPTLKVCGAGSTIGLAVRLIQDVLSVGLLSVDEATSMKTTKNELRFANKVNGNWDDLSATMLALILSVGEMRFSDTSGKKPQAAHVGVAGELKQCNSFKPRTGIDNRSLTQRLRRQNGFF